MAHLGVFSAGRTVHTWLCAYIHKDACIPMASNTSLSQQVEGIGTVAKSTTTSDTRRDVLPFPKAVSMAVLHHVLRVANLKQQEQCQATTSSLKH